MEDGGSAFKGPQSSKIARILGKILTTDNEDPC
jgi:hypothetical protein